MSGWQEKHESVFDLKRIGGRQGDNLYVGGEIRMFEQAGGIVAALESRVGCTKMHTSVSTLFRTVSIINIKLDLFTIHIV